MQWKLILGTTARALAVGICALSMTSTLGGNTPPLPRPDYMVMVIEENHSNSRIIDSPESSYINRLAAQGAVFTQFFGVSHPSQPNYRALFSGLTQGIEAFPSFCPPITASDSHVAIHAHRFLTSPSRPMNAAPVAGQGV